MAKLCDGAIDETGPRLCRWWMNLRGCLPASSLSLLRYGGLSGKDAHPSGLAMSAPVKKRWTSVIT